MADKSNPFRAALDEALAEIGVCWKRRFRSGRHADVYSWEDRWLALIVQKTISPKPWWNIPHYFEPLRVLERQHPSYLVIEVCQDEPEAGTVLEGAELERLFVGGTSDGFGNVKVFPEDLREGTYLRGADRMADFIWELLRERPPEPGLSPDMLIPTPRRRASHHKSAWMRALFAEEESPAQALISSAAEGSGLIDLTDLHMLVLPWLNFHPGHTPRTSRRVGPRRTVDEIAKCCADLAAAGFIQPTRWH